MHGNAVVYQGLDLITLYEYDDAGNVTRVSKGSVDSGVDVISSTTSYVYDNRGDKVYEIVDPDGLAITTRYVYNNEGQVIEKTEGYNSDSETTQYYVYNGNGQVRYQVNGVGSVVEYLYDVSGNITKEKHYFDSVEPQSYDDLLFRLYESQGVFTSGYVEQSPFDLIDLTENTRNFATGIANDEVSMASTGTALYLGPVSALLESGTGIPVQVENIAINTNGEIFVVWQQATTIYAQKYSAQGVMVSDVVSVGESASPVGQSGIDISISDNQLVITWRSENGADIDMRSRYYSMDIQPLASVQESLMSLADSQRQVETDKYGNVYYATVVGDSVSGYGLSYEKYTNTGALIEQNSVVSGLPTAPSYEMAIDQDGNILFVWEESDSVYSKYRTVAGVESGIGLLFDEQNINELAVDVNSQGFLLIWSHRVDSSIGGVGYYRDVLEVQYYSLEGSSIGNSNVIGQTSWRDTADTQITGLQAIVTSENKSVLTWSQDDVWQVIDTRKPDAEIFAPIKAVEDGSGNKVQVWADEDGLHYQLYDSATQQWSVPGNIDQNDSILFYDVQSDSADNIVISWLSNGSIYQKVYTGGQWLVAGEVAPVSDDRNVADFNVAYIEPDLENVSIVWNDAGVEYYLTMDALTGTWSAVSRVGMRISLNGSSYPLPASLAGLYGEIDVARIEYDPFGNAIVLFSTEDVSGAVSNYIYYLDQATGIWVDGSVADEDFDVDSLDVAFDNSGNGVLLWLSKDAIHYRYYSVASGWSSYDNGIEIHDFGSINVSNIADINYIDLGIDSSAGGGVLPVQLIWSEANNYYQTSLDDVSGLFADPQILNSYSWLIGVDDVISDGSLVGTPQLIRVSDGFSIDLTTTSQLGKGYFSAQNLQAGTYQLFYTRSAGEVTEDVYSETFIIGDDGHVNYGIDESFTEITRRYDHNNRLIMEINEIGRIDYYSYDHNGNIIDRIALSSASNQNHSVYDTYPVEKLLTHNIMSQIDLSKDRREQYVYDESNRIEYIINSIGGVIQNRYDNQGNVRETIKYKITIDSAISYYSRSSVINALSASAAAVSSSPIVGIQVDSFVYDSIGRLTYKVDAMNYVTYFEYDEMGNVTLEHRYSNPLSVPALEASDRYNYRITLADIESNLDVAPGEYTLVDAERDQYTVTNYDAAGRKWRVTDATGAYEIYTYDSLGNVKSYRNKNGDIESYSYDNAGRLTRILAPHTVFRNESGEVINHSQSKASVIEYQYDASGNKIQEILYMDLINLYEVDLDMVDVDNLNLTADNDIVVGDQVKEFVYDAAGRLVQVRHPQSVGNVQVSEYYFYDAFDNVIAEFLVQDEEVFKSVRRRYDRRGNLINEMVTGEKELPVIDNQGAISDITIEEEVLSETVYYYNSFDQMVGRLDPRGVELASRDTSWALLARRYLYESAHPVRSAQYINRFMFDGEYVNFDVFGNLAVSTDGRILKDNLNQQQIWDLASLYLTKYTYDANGNRISTVDPLGNSETKQYDAFGNVTKSTDGNNNSHYYFYDASNNLTYSVDALGYVTEYTYSSNDQVLQKRIYANRLYSSTLTLEDILALGHVSALVSVNSAKDQVLSYDYNGQGLVDIITYHRDAGSYTEHFAYDAAGNNISYTDKRGFVYKYAYNALNQKIRETSPVENIVVSFDVDNRPVFQSGALVREFEYDAVGNLRVEKEGKFSGEGSSEIVELPDFYRETIHVYDRMNREIRIVGPSSFAYNLLNSDINNPSLPLQDTRLVIDKAYDAAGNVIYQKESGYLASSFITQADYATQTTGAVGKVKETFKKYDALNRLRSEVDADRTLHVYSYDAVGNNVVARSYDDRIDENNLQDRQSIDIEILTRLSALSGEYGYRELIMNYDANNRKIGETTQEVLLFDFDTTDEGNETGRIRTRINTSIAYDAAGNVRRTIDGKGNATYYFYDRMGNKILQVDPLKHVIAWTYGANGNVTAERKFATRLSLPVVQESDLYSYDAQEIIANVLDNTASSKDRLVTYDYDNLGRISSISNYNYAIYAVDPATGSIPGVGGMIVKSYTYDGNDNILSETDSSAATGRSRVTNHEYNAFDLSVQSLEPEYTDYLGSSVRRETLRAYDVYGNLVQQTVVGDHAAPGDANEESHMIGDQVARNIYNAAGYLIYSYDSNDHEVRFGNDAFGRTVYSYQRRTDADGNVFDDVSTFRYDGMDREIERVSNGDLDSSGEAIIYSIAYNAHGQISGKGINVVGNAYQEYYLYDSVGRLFNTNSDNGTPRIYLYDANGNATLEIHSIDSDLSQVTSPDEVFTQFDLDNNRYYISRYDARNQLTDVFEPAMLSTSLDSDIDVQLREIGGSTQTIVADAVSGQNPYDNVSQSSTVYGRYELIEGQGYAYGADLVDAIDAEKYILDPDYYESVYSADDILNVQEVITQQVNSFQDFYRTENVYAVTSEGHYDPSVNDTNVVPGIVPIGTYTESKTYRLIYGPDGSAIGYEVDTIKTTDVASVPASSAAGFVEGTVLYVSEKTTETVRYDTVTSRNSDFSVSDSYVNETTSVVTDRTTRFTRINDTGNVDGTATLQQLSAFADWTMGVTRVDDASQQGYNYQLAVDLDNMQQLYGNGAEDVIIVIYDIYGHEYQRLAYDSYDSVNGVYTFSYFESQDDIDTARNILGGYKSLYGDVRVVVSKNGKVLKDEHLYDHDNRVSLNGSVLIGTQDVQTLVVGENLVVDKKSHSTETTVNTYRKKSQKEYLYDYQSKDLNARAAILPTRSARVSQTAGGRFSYKLIERYNNSKIHRDKHYLDYTLNLGGVPSEIRKDWQVMVEIHGANHERVSRPYTNDNGQSKWSVWHRLGGSAGNDTFTISWYNKTSQDSGWLNGTHHYHNKIKDVRTGRYIDNSIRYNNRTGGLNGGQFSRSINASASFSGMSSSAQSIYVDYRGTAKQTTFHPAAMIRGLSGLLASLARKQQPTFSQTASWVTVDNVRASGSGHAVFDKVSNDWKFSLSSTKVLDQGAFNYTVNTKDGYSYNGVIGVANGRPKSNQVELRYRVADLERTDVTTSNTRDVSGSEYNVNVVNYVNYMRHLNVNLAYYNGESLTDSNGDALVDSNGHPVFFKNIIHRKNEYNAFGEIKAEIDGATKDNDPTFNGNRIELIYDNMGRLVKKISPSTDIYTETVVGEDDVIRARPTETYLYDEFGNLVANVKSVDPDYDAAALDSNYGVQISGIQNRMERRVYDTAGHVVREIDPMGYITDFTYDRFGNVRSKTQSLEILSSATNSYQTTTYKYDLANRLVRQDRFAGQAIQPYQQSQYYDEYGYDESGNRIWTSAGFNNGTIALGASTYTSLVDGTDTLATAAFKMFGTRDQWEAIALANGLPTTPADTAPDEFIGGGVVFDATRYVSLAGDTLAQVSLRIWGTRTLWREILDHPGNSGIGVSGPDQVIVEGTQIYIPRDRNAAVTVKDKTFYDGTGRIIAYRSREGLETRYSYEYDAGIQRKYIDESGIVVGSTTGGFRKITSNPNENNPNALVASGNYYTQSEEKDYFGKATTSTDLGNHRFDYYYNYAGWLREQRGATGYVYTNLSEHVNAVNSGRQDTSTIPNVTRDDQLIKYTYYGNGYLESVNDLGTEDADYTGRAGFYFFRYDNNGNRVEETYTSSASIFGGTTQVETYQNTTAVYDELNRVKEVVGADHNINYYYDAFGNRRRVLARYVSDVINNVPQYESQDFFYKYDLNDRFVITMGDRVSGVIGYGQNGYSIQYNGLNQRIMVESELADASGVKHYVGERYFYNENGNLIQVQINDGDMGNAAAFARRATRTTNTLGQVIQYTNYGPDGNTVAGITRKTWDLDNHLNAESRSDRALVGQDRLPGWTHSWMEYSYWTDGITLDKSYSYGHQVADNSSDERPHLNTQTMVYNYAVADMWDMYKERSVVVSANNPDISASRNSNWQDGESYYLYNSNGHHLRVFDAQGHRELGYKLNHLGQVLQRQEYRAVIDGGNGDPQNRNFYYLNGITVGDFGTDKVLSRYDYAASLAEVNSDQHGDFGDRIVPTSSANFDQNYQPINPAYPGGAPTQVVVQAGDTLQVLAARLWGDSSLWYLLADANGLDSNSTLTEGQRLSVPNVVTNIHNNSETFKPYDPGLAIGDTTPTLPDPPPPPKPGCAKLVLVAVVAVAVAWALTPMIVQTMAAWGAGLGAAIGAGATAMSALAITGAVIGAGLVAGISSFASQLAARRLGLVDDIDKGSIRDAFKAGALTKAFTYGIDQALSSSRTLEEARSVVDVGNLNDGVKTLNQMRTSWYESSIFNDIGTGLKTGFANAAASAMVQDGKFRDNFDWHTVAASVVVAPVAGYVRRNIFNSEIGGKSVTQFSAALDESGNYAAMGSAFAFEGSAPNTPGHAFMNSLIAEGLESYASYRFHHRKDKYRPDAAGLFAGALVSAGASFYAQYQQNRREEKQYQAYNNRYVGDVASYLADPNTGFHESVLSGKELKLELAPEDIRRYLEQFQYDMQTRTPLDGVDGPEAEPYEGVQVLSSSPSSESPRDDRRYMYPMIADISDYRADPYAEKLNSTYGFEGFGLLDDTDKWLKLALSADFTRAESYDKYREANDFIVGKIGEYQEHINGMGDRLTQFLYADKLDLYKQNMIDQGYYLNKDINPSLDGVPTAKGADELFGFIESRSLSRAEDIGARVKDVVMAETTDVTEINQKVKEVLREYLFDYIGQEGNGFIDGIGVEQAYDTTFTDNMNLMSKLSDSLSEERKYSGNTDLSKGLGGLASGLTYTKAFIEYFKYDDPYQASETLLGEGLETIGTKYLMPKAVSGFKKLIWGARVTAAGSSSTGVGIGAGLSMFLMAELADQTANVIMKEIKPWMNKEDRSRTYDQLFENKLKPELARRFTQAESGAIINQALSSTSSEVKLGEHSASIYSLRKYSFMNEKYSAFVGQAFDANRRSAFYYYRPGTIAQ